MGRHAFLTSLAVLALVASGCADNASTRSAGPSSTAAAPTVSQDKGSVTGQVTDEELQPLAGVDIALTGPTESSTTSDATGRFTINELEPGSYVVNSLKLGYEQVAKRIEVAAGQTEEVTLTLKAVAIESEPFIDFKIHDGLIDGPSFYCFCVIVLPGGKSITLNLTQGAQDIVATMEWQVNQPTSTRYLQLAARYPETGTARQSNSTSGASPQTTKLSELEVEKAKEKAVLSYSVGFLCYNSSFTAQCLSSNPDALVPVVVYQQRVKVYSSVFYNQLAPEGYTGLPG